VNLLAGSNYDNRVLSINLSNSNFVFFISARTALISAISAPSSISIWQYRSISAKNLALVRARHSTGSQGFRPEYGCCLARHCWSERTRSNTRRKTSPDAQSSYQWVSWPFPGNHRLAPAILAAVFPESGRPPGQMAGPLLLHRSTAEFAARSACRRSCRHGCKYLRKQGFRRFLLLIAGS
jgi:hypothetical protein